MKEDGDGDRVWGEQVWNWNTVQFYRMNHCQMSVWLIMDTTELFCFFVLPSSQQCWLTTAPGSTVFLKLCICAVTLHYWCSEKEKKTGALKPRGGHVYFSQPQGRLTSPTFTYNQGILFHNYHSFNKRKYFRNESNNSFRASFWKHRRVVPGPVTGATGLKTQTHKPRAQSARN